MDELSEQKKRRFERWRATLPRRTRFLADLVAGCVIPEFEQRGFKWHRKATAGFLYLVREESGCWPAVQLRFHKRARPMAFVDVGCLPEVCRQWNGNEFDPVPREEADIVDGLAYFAICNPRRSGRTAQADFGYQYFSLAPERRITREVDAMVSVLPRLFDVFDEKVLESRERWPEVTDLLTLHGDRMEEFNQPQ